MSCNVVLCFVKVDGHSQQEQLHFIYLMYLLKQWFKTARRSRINIGFSYWPQRSTLWTSLPPSVILVLQSEHSVYRQHWQRLAQMEGLANSRFGLLAMLLRSSSIGRQSPVGGGRLPLSKAFHLDDQPACSLSRFI